MDVSLQRTKDLLLIRIPRVCRIPFQGRVETVLLQSGSLLLFTSRHAGFSQRRILLFQGSAKSDKPLNEAVFQHLRNMSKL